MFSTQLMQTGGIESHINEFVEKMSISGLYELDILVLNSKLSIEQESFIKSRCSWSCFLSDKSFRQFPVFIRVIWKILSQKYDALYTNGQGNSIILISKIFKHKKWVHHHHTSGDLADQRTWSTSYQHALKKSNVVVACSIKNAFDMMRVLDRKVTSIPCFSRKITINQKKATNDGKVRLGYFGRLIPEKGIDLLCKLSNDFDLMHIQFHIWGEGSQYDLTFFQKFPNVVFHGSFRSEEELREVLETIDGYLLLSTHPEGLPISLLELMGAGIPWMATNKGGISDIACDPKATRLLDSLEPYESLKDEVKEFAFDIAAGNIDRQNQINLYDTKFASKVLINLWQEVLLKAD